MTVVYISFQTGKKENTVSMLSIINHAEVLENGKLKYLTKDGIKIQSKEDIENNNISIISKEQIDIKDSLSYWFRSNQGNQEKPLIENESLETGQDYYGSSWRYGLRLLVSESKIEYRLILH